MAFGMDIKVLSTGCANCKNTIAFIYKVAQAKGVAVQLEKVGDIRAIMGLWGDEHARLGTQRGGEPRDGWRGLSHAGLELDQLAW
jgi:hypothetical protein